MRPFAIIWLTLVGFGVAGCLETGGGGDGDIDGDVDGDTSGGGYTVETAFAGPTGAFTPDPAATDAVVVPYSLATAAGSNVFTIDGPQRAAARGLTPLPSGLAGLERKERAIRQQNLLHASRRAIAALDLSPSQLIETRMPGDQCATHGECGALEVCDHGVCASELGFAIKDWNGGPAETAMARLASLGDHCAVFVEQGDSLEQADADAIRDAWDGVVWPRLTALYGDDPLLDRDRNGVTILFLTGRVNAMDGLAGYFNYEDMVSASQFPESNERDILFLVVPDADNPLEVIFATLAHELHHLIHFGIKTLKPVLNGGTSVSEAVWLDEACSHLAEDVAGYGSDNVTNPYVFLQNPCEASVTLTDIDGRDAGDSIANRGAVYLFLRHLFERAGGVTYNQDGTLTDRGGAAFLRRLVSSNTAGMASIEAGLDISQRILMADWLAAMYLNGQGAGDGIQTYRPVADDPVTGFETGIDLSATRIDAQGNRLIFSGPATLPFSGPSFQATVQSGGGCYVSLAGGADGMYSFSADPAAAIAAILIQSVPGR